MTYVYKVKEGERWSVPFLEHHKRKRMTKREEKRKTNKQTKANPKPNAIYKSQKVMICMSAT
jgi:hypothetical protein